MGKQIIRLTESDLHRIVKGSVNKIVTEVSDMQPYFKDEFDTNKKVGDFPVEQPDWVSDPRWEGWQGEDPEWIMRQQKERENAKRLSPIERKYLRIGEQDIHRIVKESVNRILNEVKMQDSDGRIYSNLHGNDPNAWRKLNRERAARIGDINAEIKNQQKNGYVDDMFGAVSDLNKEKSRNCWNIGRNTANEIELDNSGRDMSYLGVDSSDPEDRKRYADELRTKLNSRRPDMSVKTKSRNGTRWNRR